MNKYHNIKTIVDGIKFDSRKEANHYCELKLLQKAGIISDLKLQPRYLLQNSFKYNGKIERAIEYVADFEYVEKGKVIVEDCKGMKTDVYKLKRKLFLYRYDLVEFREV
jgi:hypothetical protein